MGYYLWTDGVETGPISDEEFNRRADLGQLPPGVLCRSEDGTDWVSPKEILEAAAARAGARPTTASQRRRRFGGWHWVLLGVFVCIGVLCWFITKTKLWEIVAASAVGVVGAAIGLTLLGLISIWAVLWTVFPVFVFFYLQDILAEVVALRRLAQKRRGKQ